MIFFWGEIISVLFFILIDSYGPIKDPSIPLKRFNFNIYGTVGKTTLSKEVDGKKKGFLRDEKLF